MSDDRTEILGRIEAVLHPLPVPAGVRAASIEDLRECLEDFEQAARDIERYGRLGAVWKADDEAAQQETAAAAEA